MLIVISAEGSIPHETEIIRRMLSAAPEMHFHWRKPGGTVSGSRDFLAALTPEERARIVVHQLPALREEFPEIGLHAKSGAEKTHETVRERFGNVYSNPAIPFRSTSFHSPEDALREGAAYTYFFCSPVFPSISKQGYMPSEDWEIRRFPDWLKRKAVALGGISAETFEDARMKGFRHFAFLGAIWQKGDPIENCIQAATLCREQDHIA